MSFVPTGNAVKGIEVKTTVRLNCGFYSTVDRGVTAASTALWIVVTQWQRSWDNILINKLKKIKPIIVEWPSSQRSNRMEEVVLTRLRIGHTRLTHKHIFTREPQPLCQCGDILTIHHILVCITHAHIRASLPSPPSLADDVEGVDSLFLYLKTLNLFNLI
ncbi:hypothetical protein M8J77_010861 [Diaphorina citri]|nr:hypothetical protein M8J77_010861 [Diaphorina citri]